MKTKKRSQSSSRFTRGVKVGAKHATKRHARKTSGTRKEKPMEEITGW